MNAYYIHLTRFKKLQSIEQDRTSLKKEVERDSCIVTLNSKNDVFADRLNCNSYTCFSMDLFTLRCNLWHNKHSFYSREKGEYQL